MFRSVKQLCGEKLAASDGHIGRVKDFYFDDQNWVVRYLVADTGFWLSGRQVLLSPHAVSSLDRSAKILRVNLARKQIEACPSIELHKPVSRQFEEEYYRHYGWSRYWQGGALWGMSAFPIMNVTSTPSPSEQAATSGRSHEGTDPHLRSTQAVTGYHLRTGDGIVGHICDFIMDHRSWAIPQLVIKTGHRFSGKEVQIPTDQVSRISYEESTVFVKLTSAAVESSPVQHVDPAEGLKNTAAAEQDYET
jgi:uncharacterized protein YrrD